MTRQTKSDAMREWLDKQITKHITEYALKACCIERPPCAEPCDDCWSEAEDEVKSMMRQIADEFRSH